VEERRAQEIRVSNRQGFGDCWVTAAVVAVSAGVVTELSQDNCEVYGAW
jgi:hypothetical protein